MLTLYVKYIGRKWRIQLLALVVSCTAIAAVLVSSLLTKMLIDRVLLERNGELLVWIVCGMFGLIIVRLVLSVLSRLLSAHIAPLNDLKDVRFVPSDEHVTMAICVICGSFYK